MEKEVEGSHRVALERYQSRNPARHLFAKLFQRKELFQIWTRGSKSKEIPQELATVAQGLGLVYILTTDEFKLTPEEIQSLRRIQITAATELDNPHGGAYTE